MKKILLSGLAVLLLLGVCVLAVRATRLAPETETVIVKYQVKQGQEAEFKKSLGKLWPTLRRLNLVLAEPHMILRGEDDAHNVYFVEILTWVDAEAPDHLPDEVHAISREMFPHLEARGGRPGFDVQEVRIVSDADLKH